MNGSQSIERARDVIRRQHKTLATEQTYLYWLRHYIAAIRSMPTELPSERKMERFLTELAVKKNVSASTQSQAFNAILFFYRDVLGQRLENIDALRATRPDRIRHAPTIDEVRKLIKDVRDIGGYPTNLIVRMLYGCGLRVTEPLNLRIKDVDLINGRITLIAAKGRKDRIVALPCSLVEEIRQQMDYSKAIWQRDVKAGIPLEIPNQLGKKYPEYRLAWTWAWLFPSHWPCKHPRTGELVRYRMHEANVQRAVKESRRRIGIMVLCHELRHGYATHCLERGTNIKALQAAMGHESIETTAGYCHAEALSVKSPLEA